MKKIIIYHENQGELVYYKNDNECAFWIDEQEQNEIWGTSDKYTIEIEDVESAPKTADGKPMVRADSRPLGLYTYFTCQADDVGIGDGQEIFWDFSNDNCTISGAPVGYKRKRMIMKHNDPIWLKEGAIYFHGALKGSYADMMVVCPAGNYYYNRDGSLAYAYEDVVIIHYIRKHFFAGDCPMGDELNTEGCSDVPTPTSYIMWCQVTVPDVDDSSYGWASFELYRPRTCLLPNESV